MNVQTAGFLPSPGQSSWWWVHLSLQARLGKMKQYSDSEHEHQFRQIMPLLERMWPRLNQPTWVLGLLAPCEIHHCFWAKFNNSKLSGRGVGRKEGTGCRLRRPEKVVMAPVCAQWALPVTEAALVHCFCLALLVIPSPPQMPAWENFCKPTALSVGERPAFIQQTHSLPLCSQRGINF